MKPITPDPNMFFLPPGTKAVNVAENQPEYDTLPSLITPDGKFVSQWMLEPNDLELIKNGVPVTLVLLMGQPVFQVPVQLAVGGMDLTDENV